MDKNETKYYNTIVLANNNFVFLKMYHNDECVFKKKYITRIIFTVAGSFVILHAFEYTLCT